MQKQSPQILKLVPQLTISPTGIFKYILIKCSVNGQPSCNFVRGDKNLQYHSDNFDQFQEQLIKYGFTEVKMKRNKITANKNGNKYQFMCPGGGRIEHNYNGNKCWIYGYSQSYGYVDHAEAQKIISSQLGYASQEIKLGGKDY